jgi:hypothetical protein
MQVLQELRGGAIYRSLRPSFDDEPSANDLVNRVFDSEEETIDEEETIVSFSLQHNLMA